MKLRLSTFFLVSLLAFGVACNKPSSTSDNATPGSDSGGTSDSSSASPAATKSSPRMPETITVPAGTVLTVRLADAVGSKISQAGQSFGGSLAKPVEVNGVTAIPEGTKVSGEVVDAKPLGHFAGGALLQLRLNNITIGGDEMPVETATFTQTIKGKGKRTAVLAGGGAAVGALIGGLAGGGKGAAIGAGAGGGAGTAGAALTGNKEIVLPAESAVPFALKAPLKIKH
jgi:hypothetical protein